MFKVHQLNPSTCLTGPAFAYKNISITSIGIKTYKSLKLFDKSMRRGTKKVRWFEQMSYQNQRLLKEHKKLEQNTDFVQRKSNDSLMKYVKYVDKR